MDTLEYEGKLWKFQYLPGLFFCENAERCRFVNRISNWYEIKHGKLSRLRENPSLLRVLDDVYKRVWKEGLSPRDDVKKCFMFVDSYSFDNVLAVTVDESDFYIQRHNVTHMRSVKDKTWFVSVGRFQWQAVENNSLTELEYWYNYIKKSRLREVWGCKCLPVFGFSTVKFPTQHQFHYIRSCTGEWRLVLFCGSKALMLNKPFATIDKELPIVEMIYNCLQDQMRSYEALEVVSCIGEKVLDLEIIEFLYKDGSGEQESCSGIAIKKEKVSSKHHTKLKERLTSQPHCSNENEPSPNHDEQDISSLTASIFHLTIHDSADDVVQKNASQSHTGKREQIDSNKDSPIETRKAVNPSSGDSQKLENTSSEKPGLCNIHYRGRGSGRRNIYHPYIPTKGLPSFSTNSMSHKSNEMCESPQENVGPVTSFNGTNNLSRDSDGTIKSSQINDVVSKSYPQNDGTGESSHKSDVTSKSTLDHRSVETNKMLGQSEGSSGTSLQHKRNDTPLSDTNRSENVTENALKESNPREFKITETSTRAGTLEDNKGRSSVRTKTSSDNVPAGMPGALLRQENVYFDQGTSNLATKLLSVRRKSQDNRNSPACTSNDTKNELSEAHKPIELANTIDMNTFVDSPSQNTRSKTVSSYADKLKCNNSLNSKAPVNESPYGNTISGFSASIARDTSECNDLGCEKRTSRQSSLDFTNKTVDCERNRTSNIATDTDSTNYKPDSGFHQGLTQTKTDEINRQETLTANQRLKILGEIGERLKDFYLQEGKSGRGESQSGNQFVPFWFNTTDGVLKGLENLVPMCQRYKRLLVIGKPNFGKSLLCSLIPQHWAKNDIQCELCFCLTAEDFRNFTSLLEMLVKKVQGLFTCSFFFDIKTLKDVLEQAADKILVVIDGLDEISSEDQNVFSDSFADCVFFRKLFVLTTSRPLGSTDLRSHFYCIEIYGFEELYFKMVTQTCAGNKHDFMSRFSTFYKNAKLVFLTGFPPKYVHFAAEVFARKNPMMMNIFDLLYDFMLKQAMSSPCNHIEVASRKLGQICLNALQCGFLNLTKSSLQSIAGEHFNLIWEFGAFVEPRNDTQELLECPEVLVVFFATLYLRHLWDRAENETEKNEMVKRYFCCEGTIGDIVMDNNTNIKYLVGHFPEVVLKMEPDGSREFEMHYDVKCNVESSTAFDSVNLLLRLNRKFLRRFGFEEADECDMQERFADMINIFEFDGTVSMQFFSNSFENRDFLEWNVEGTEIGVSVLQGIVVKNKSRSGSSTGVLQFDKLYLSFLFSEMENLSNFVFHVLGLSLSDEERSKALMPSVLLEYLINAMKKIKERRVLSFSISDTGLSSNYISTMSCETLSVIINSTNLGQCRSSIFCRPTSMKANPPTNQGELLRVVDKTCQSFSNPIISLYLK